MAKVDAKQGTFIDEILFSFTSVRPYPSLNTRHLAKKIEKETWKAGWEL